MNPASRLKTLVIGLDGATFDVILPFIEEGRLPALASLLEQGAWGKLRSTIPPITAAAWTSFMTGENPGKHGIIDFMKRTGPHGSPDEVVTTSEFSGRTFFDSMARAGHRVGAITVPVTYPPWSINGIMISGYPCPDNDKVYSAAEGIVYTLEEPLNFSAEYYKTASEEDIAGDCLHRDRLRADLMFDLLERYPFDCFTLVLGGIDRAQHDYWKYHDPSFPDVEQKRRERFRDVILNNYQLADRVIATALEKFGDGITLFILSDHGAGRHPFSHFNVNVWLREKGFLGIRKGRALVRETGRKAALGLYRLLTPRNRKRPGFLPAMRAKSPAAGGGGGKVFDWERTKAFFSPLMYPAGGITINLQGRQPRGTVAPGREYHDTVNAIVAGLRSCRDPRTGEQVAEQVFRREELYQGPYTTRFPDIVYILNRKFETGRNVLGKTVTPVQKVVLAKKSGLHLLDGIFIARGPRIRGCRLQGARIIDVAPTLLYSAGLPLPDTMDGRVLHEIFEEQTMKNRPVRYCTGNGPEGEREVFVSSTENEQMKDKLRGLGYL